MAQVKLLKLLADGTLSEMDTSNDDITLNSYTGDGAALSNLNATNIASGTIDKARLPSDMAGNGLDYTAGVLSVDPIASSGIGVDANGVYVDYDGDTLGITGGKLAYLKNVDIFKTISVATQSDVVADSDTDTLTLAAGTDISITTNAGTDTITIAATGGTASSLTASLGVARVGDDFRSDYDSTLTVTGNDLGINLSNANTWEAAQSLSGFAGDKLIIYSNAGDAETKVFNVKNSGGTSVASIDEDGDMIVNDLTVNGAETVVGNITGQSSLSLEQNLIVSGYTDLKGTVTLGDATGDDVTFNGYVDSTIIPKTDNTYTLGDATHAWSTVYAENIGNGVKTIDVDNIADLSAAETVAGAWTFSALATFDGSVDLGDNTGDTVTYTARVDSDIDPSASGTYDLGDAALTWKTIYAENIGDGSEVINVSDIAQLSELDDNAVADSDGASLIGYKETTGGDWDSTTGDVANALDELASRLKTEEDKDSTETLQEAYVGGNVITTDNSNGDLQFAGTETLDVDIASDFSGTMTLSGGANLTGTGGSVLSGFDSIEGITSANLVDKSATETISGAWTFSNDAVFQEDVDLGSATDDLISVAGRFDTSLVPSASGTYDLGSSTLTWDNVYVENIGNNAGTIDVDNLVDKGAAEAITGSWDFTGGSIDLPTNFSVNNVATTNMTAANLNTLSDGSNADALHSHAGVASEDVKLPFTASGAINDGAPVYIVTTADDTIREADATVIGTGRIVGISEAELANSATGYVIIQGFSTIPADRIDGGSFTRGAPVFLSENTGKLTSTRPTGSGVTVYQVGLATTTTKMIIAPKIATILS